MLMIFLKNFCFPDSHFKPAVIFAFFNHSKTYILYQSKSDSICLSFEDLHLAKIDHIFIVAG
jgi:hypothetical protein